MAWYSQPGTPEVEVNTEYDAQQKLTKRLLNKRRAHLLFTDPLWFDESTR